MAKIARKKDSACECVLFNYEGFGYPPSDVVYRCVVCGTFYTTCEYSIDQLGEGEQCTLQGSVCKGVDCDGLGTFIISEKEAKKIHGRSID